MRQSVLCPCLLVLLPMLTACGAPEPEEGGRQTAPPPAGQPVETTDSESPSPPAEPITDLGIEQLTWTTPVGWQKTKPTTMIRRAQYLVPGRGGDAECAVFYFGDGQGADIMPDAMRWAERFTQPDGRPSSELLATRRVEVNGIFVELVEVTGTYDGGVLSGAPKKNLTGYMLLGAIVSGHDADWFFELTGPRETVEANRQAFEEVLIGSLESVVS